MYPQHLIDEVRNAADIVDVVSDYVKLKKSGGYWIGSSPFKAERTPSFTVTPSKGIYKCFSTGKGGNVFTFLMEVEGLSFTESVRSLAKRFNITLPEEATPEDNVQARQREGIFHALRFAQASFQRNLLESDAAEAARAYVKKRGLTIDAIRKFGLGFSLPSYSQLLKEAQSAGINTDYLYDAGLVRKKEEGTDYWDYFRDRLMFPIFDVSNRVIGFGGRVLEQAQGPKYLNSPETPVYHKSAVLYGIQNAKNEFRKKDQAILVEGYMDVIALQNNGIMNAVATSGTALTAEQARIINRYTQNLLLIYDADEAGQNAMIRGLPICLREGLLLKMLHLPDGEDPDSFIKVYGGEAFSGYTAEHAKNFVDFLIERAQLQGKWDEATDRKAVIDLIVENLALVKDPLMRELLSGELANKSSIGTRTIQTQVVGAAKKAQQQEQRYTQREQPREETPAATGTIQPSPFERPATHQKPLKRPPYELELLRLMLEHGLKMVEFVGSYCNADYFEDAELRQLFEELINKFQVGEYLTSQDLVALPPPFPIIAADILSDPARPGDRSIRRMQESGRELPSPWKSAKGALRQLCNFYYQRKINELIVLMYDENKVPYGGDSYKRLKELEKHLKTKQQDLINTPIEDYFPNPEGISDNVTTAHEHDFRS